ncbi:MAG: hypothetical protein B7X77_12535, partial [Caulobacter sp. 39-67-4]
AGATAEEIDDPRVWAEVIRQWSTLHPEFSYLPRKFKIAITGAAKDRTAAKVHDIGLMLRRARDGSLGFEVIVGGGQGRTPYVGPTIKEHLPVSRLLSYLEAVLRVYNRHGRRDNIYKARIKILVAALGAEEFGRQVEEEWAKIDAARADLPDHELARIRGAFASTPFETLPERSDVFEAARAASPVLQRFARNNIKPHKKPGYAIVEISLKAQGQTPGDATADQLDLIADLAEQYSLNDVRVTHAQNMVLPHVKLDDVPAVHAALAAAGLATANIDLASDIIACPGLDYCALANARAIGVAQDIAAKFADEDHAEKVGELKIKISGCINACGHHHVAHIGILGVDKKGEEFYQLSLGGSGAEDASIGKILGPALPADKVAGAIDTLVEALAYDLPRLAVVAVAFPKFRDGRAYTSARLLRERFNYQGEVRAVGDVLQEQAGFMVRCGMDAFEPADGAGPEVWTKAANRFRHVYQRAADARPVAFEERSA